MVASCGTLEVDIVTTVSCAFRVATLDNILADGVIVDATLVVA